MFVCITGEPGSGKSAYAVDFILKHKEEYKNVYVNINGFKMHDNVKALNFPYLYDVISKCKAIYDEQISTLGNSGNDNVIDGPIVQYLISIGFLSKNPAYDDYLKKLYDRKKEKILKRTVQNFIRPIEKVSEFLPTLFVIDEVQNHMGAIDPDTGKELRTADPILSWWVSYHRHLYMDVLILSQQYQKIHIAYRRDVSYFLDAIESQSLLLGKYSLNFVYNKYKETPYFEKKKTAKVKVKKRSALFKAYHSGDAVRSKSILLPWIIFSFVMLSAVGFLFSYILDSYGNNEEVETNSTKKIIKNFQKINQAEIKNTLNTGMHYINLNCIAKICTQDTYKIKINVDDLEYIVKLTESEFLQVKKHSATFATVTLLASQEFINLFQGAYNENKGFSLIN